MLGLWNEAYKQLNPSRYGSDESYLLAEKYLKGLDIEDWGCGEGRFRDFHEGLYVGIDGSKSPGAHVITDLRKYKSESDGILLRHVLEHNIDWKKILKNAKLSYKKTMVVVICTPFQASTQEIGWSQSIGVPDIGFSLTDLREVFPEGTDEHLYIPSPSTQYGSEHVFVSRR